MKMGWVCPLVLAFSASVDLVLITSFGAERDEKAGTYISDWLQAIARKMYLISLS